MDKTGKILILIAIIMMAISFFTIYFSTPRNIDKIDTVITTRVDTFWNDTVIEKTKYIPKKVEVIKTDTILKDTILTTELKTYIDTLCSNNDSIILKNYISGTNSNLDSTSVDWRKHKEIITNTVEITKYIEKKKTFFDKFKVGVQVGYGYGFKSKELEPYAGIGVTFSF